MSIWLHPHNKDLDRFTIGSACWGYILEHAGFGLWPVMHNEARWFALTGVDPRVQQPEGGRRYYPAVLGDSGETFRVYAHEARVLANVAQHLAEMNELLPRREDVIAPMRTWPTRVRDDWPPIWLDFADWARASHGFVKGG